MFGKRGGGLLVRGERMKCVFFPQRLFGTFYAFHYMVHYVTIWA